MKNRVQAGLLIIFLTVLGVLGYNAWLLETTPPERTYTEFLTDVKNGQVTVVHLKGPEIRGEDRSGRQFRTFLQIFRLLYRCYFQAESRLVLKSHPPFLIDS